jgi:hypothetical protein
VIVQHLQSLSFRGHSSDNAWTTSPPTGLALLALAAIHSSSLKGHKLAIGWNGQPPNATACIFWLKNRKKDQWRDTQNVEAGPFSSSAVA